MTTLHDNICLFDMDGTLCDFDGEMRRQLQLIQGPEEQQLDIADLFETGTTPDWMEARKTLIKSQPGFWRNLPRLRLGFDILRASRVYEFENHILTQGPRATNAAWLEKKEWCDINVPDMAGVTITQKKSLSYGKVLVDDWPAYFLPWLEVRPRGFVIAVAQPWNKDVKHPNLVRYDGSNVDEVWATMEIARNRQLNQP